MSNQNVYSKIPFLRSAPDEVKAIITKLIPDPTTNGNNSPSKPKIVANQGMFDRISRETAQDVVDANAIFQLLPDVELASQILVGSIISPKDMSTVELGYSLDGNQFDSEVTRSLLGVIEEYFKNDYKIDDRLDLILKDILFMKGASITAIIPENSLDFMINGQRRLSLETYDKVLKQITQGKPMGFLGHPRDVRVSMESFNDREGTVGKIRSNKTEGYIPGLFISDNFDHLKLPRIRDKRRTEVINKLLKKRHVSMESAAQGLSSQEIDKLYKRLDTKSEPTRIVPNPSLFEAASIGHPLTMELPVESVIPVHVPGDPANHVGYFILIDQTGRPVQRDNSIDYYGELRTAFSANTKDNSSEMLRQVREAMGSTTHTNRLEYDQIQEAYNRIVESDLIARLRNGIYQEDLSVGFTDEIYRIMLYRSFKAKNTQLIYIPAELVIYMAFDFNRYGIGQTLLTKSKILSSMRSVLLFAETMSGVRNAIGRKRTSITIDPQDPDPQKTISDIQTAILESSHRGFPLGSPDPAQTLDYLNRAGYDFNINIDSEDYPTTKVEFDDYNTQVNAGNTELQERLQKMHISGMGLSPEWVDPQQAPEFAVSVITNNLLMQRRVMGYQKGFVGFITQFVRTYTQHSGKLRSQLKEVLEDNKKSLDLSKEETVDDALDTFISALLVTLPSPDNTKIDIHIAAYEQYTQLLEKALEAYITPDLFPADLLAQDSTMVDQTIAVIKAYFQRSWLERNNVLPELDQLTTFNEEGDKLNFNLLDIQTNLFETIGNVVNEYIKGINKLKEQWTKENTPVEETPPEGTTDITPTDETPVDETSDDLTGDLTLDEESSDLMSDETDEESEDDSTTTDEETPSPKEEEITPKEETPPAEEEKPAE